MSDTIREVPDNVEATEAWNGPLFEVWIEFRDLVAESLRLHSEAALAATPPPEGALSSTSAAGSGTRRCGWPSWWAPTVTRTAWTSPGA